MKCSPARIGAVKVGTGAWALSDWTRYMLQTPFTESGPPSLAPLHPWGPPVVRSTCELVPIHAMSTRPSSAAAIHANTLLLRPGVGTCIGVDQVTPWFVEYEYMSAALPPLLFVRIGDCAHTA